MHLQTLALATCFLVAGLSGEPASAEGRPKEPAGEGPSGLRLKSSDAYLVDVFDWARASAERHVGSDSDPVGPWYEAALPGREAFCIRDVSHQCIGAEILGCGRQNRNMLRRFVGAVSESRDFCSFWEINRWGKPAPVDYASDDDFWYNLNANFDLIDACFRLYQWTGDRAYVDGPEFDRFFRLTLNEYVQRWQLGPDSIMSRSGLMNLKTGTRKYRMARGIPSYDEGQGDLAVGSDLIGMIGNAYRVYARILELRGKRNQASRHRSRAEEYRRLIDSRWWDERSQSYFAFYTTKGEFRLGGVSLSEFLLWYQAVDAPQRIVKSLRDIGNTQVEVLSYLPMLYYRYGLNQEGYEFLGKIHADPRRDYPEASFAAVEGTIRGLMGVEPSASEGLVTTCPRLTSQTAWAEVENVPALGGRISVRHVSARETRFTNHSDRALTWRAMFQGHCERIRVAGEERPALHLQDAACHMHSYVDVEVGPESRATAETE